MSPQENLKKNKKSHDNILKFIIFISLFLSIGTYFAPNTGYSSEKFSDFLATLISLIISASSLFFIIFAFSIHQEIRHFEKLREEMEKEIKTGSSKVQRLEDEMAERFERHDQMMQQSIEQYKLTADKAVKDFREVDRRRWKMVSINIIQIFADMLQSINDGENTENIKEDLQKLLPLRYLLQSVTEDNIRDTITALSECAELAYNPNISLSEEMFGVLFEAIDAQRMYIENDPEIKNPEQLKERLQQIENQAKAAQGIKSRAM